MAGNNPQPSNWQQGLGASPDKKYAEDAEAAGRGPERPVNERLRQEAELLQRTAKSYGRPPASAVPDQSQSPASLWPTQLVTPHPEDEIRNIQKTLVTDKGVVPGVGMAIADSDYFKYQKEKADQIELAKFKAFVSNAWTFLLLRRLLIMNNIFLRSLKTAEGCWNNNSTLQKKQL
jgi:hypothetical protein